MGVSVGGSWVAVRVAGGGGVNVWVGTGLFVKVLVTVKVRVGVRVGVCVRVGVAVSVVVGTRKPVDVGRGVDEDRKVTVMATPGTKVAVQVAGIRYCGVKVSVGRTSSAGTVGGGNGFRLV